MRRENDYFGDLELDLVYMARSLRDALRLEKLLTDTGIDYLVETGTYTGGFLFKRDLTGAYFYVAPQELELARDTLQKHGHKPYGQN